MGACIILTPIVIASWPMITAVAASAVSSMGFAIARKAEAEVALPQTATRVDMAIEDSEILENTGVSAEKLVVERDGVRATFSRDARGALKVCMEGKGQTEAQLRALGEELVGRVTQQYAYHKIMTEMKKRNMVVVDEQVTADKTVKIRLRRV